MPKLTNTVVPSYRLHKQSGHAVVTLKGKHHTLGRYDSPESRNKYDRLISEWVANGRQMPRPSVQRSGGDALNRSSEPALEIV